MSILGLSILDTKPVTVGAGFWIRALARLVDTVYGFALGVVAGVFGAIIVPILEALSVVEPGWGDRISQGSNLMPTLMSLVGYLFYYTTCEGLCGASLGKLVCGLRVLSEDLSPCSLKPAFVRSLAGFVDGLFFGVIGYMSMSKTLTQQRHGDHWARTVVVRNSQVPLGSKRSTTQYLLALALGSVAWGLALVAGLLWRGLR
jgi:uncharacterized RDD family membrane protein YckC